MVQTIAQQPTVSDEVDITAIDIITRSLVLKDLHMKNYGRADVDVITVDRLTVEKHKWKLIDFLVLSPAQLEEYDVHSGI
eukprot:gene43564-58012_t